MKKIIIGIIILMVEAAIPGDKSAQQQIDN